MTNLTKKSIQENTVVTKIGGFPCKYRYYWESKNLRCSLNSVESYAYLESREFGNVIEREYITTKKEFINFIYNYNNQDIVQ